jgi:hypothetical protein
MDLIDALQWPAMLLNVIAAWLIASQSRHRRGAGFYLFLLSNALWMAWGWHSQAYALVIMQLALSAMNIRGVLKTEEPARQT